MKIYRYRDATQKTIEELKTPYLWFPTREGFNDVNDANIHALFAKNPEFLEKLRELAGDQYIQKYEGALDTTGICCFTRSLRSKKGLSHFPGKKSIAIVYNKGRLLEFLANTYYINTKKFARNIRYSKNPTYLFGWDNNKNDIAVDSFDNVIRYEPIARALSDEKIHDSLIANAFSVLDTKYRKQNEFRIIMGCNIIEINIELEKIIQIGNGYKVNVSNDTIEKVYVYPNTPNWFIDELNKISSLEGKIKSYH
ncbi:MAG: hypothetical protein K6G73_07875 [Marinilabiliaceae bacterium]|nr:hypothetical protein [Marinilabiliaceae bacterium]